MKMNEIRAKGKSHGVLVETERRRYRRVACEVHASYSAISEKKKGAIEKSITMNVSPSGVMFPVSHHIAPHTLVDIKLFLPPRSFFHTSAVTAKAIGEVRWAKRVNGSSRYNLGVQFTNIKDEDRERIAVYIYE